ncbi:MAG: putative glycolipid-binding domain-containing protein [Actinomycetales bacterium]|nr:putative glycolipid-binding domain-containing protein [Actinomycetales bacterium]
MTTRLVAWRQSGATQADEHCRLDLRASGVSLEGTVLGAQGGIPVRAQYRVIAGSDGLTATVHVRFHRGLSRRETTLVRAPEGSWTVDGVSAPHLDGCTDVDLGCSPATNTLPLRRLRLEVGDSRTIRAAWVRFPELTVAAADQTYTRLGEHTYLYASGSYTAELTVDDLRLVTTYDEWRRTGMVEPS